MKKGRLILLVSVCIGISALLIVGDLFDVFSRLGINVPELNMDFVSIVLSNAVVIILFIIAYNYVDKRNIKAMDNKRELGLHLLQTTCESCKTMERSLSIDVIKQIIVPKIDFNATKNQLLDNLKVAPFSFDMQLMELFTDGTLTKKEFVMYTELKSQYGIAINTRIVFFDAPAIQAGTNKKYQTALNDLECYLSEGRKNYE